MPMQICKKEDTGRYFLPLISPCVLLGIMLGNLVSFVLVNQPTTASQLANDDKEDC